MNDELNRPSPDQILENIKHDEERRHKGRLKIFLGMCAGVGKTYTMLQSAQGLQLRGIKVLVGYIETHKRAETEALLKGLRVLPRLQITYKEREFNDFNLDAVLLEKPDVVIVDELAHSNIPGMRHEKRYQDILELIDNGISVLTTLNVQHLESQKDTVRQITQIEISETVPDSILDRADEIELVDLSPQDLLVRLAEGKVYLPERAKTAAANFFTISNLIALREIALRAATQHVDIQLTGDMRSKGVEGPWKTGERLMVAVGRSPYSEQLIRWTRRIASTMKAPWIAVYVQQPGRLTEVGNVLLQKNINLAQELGAELVTTTDDNVAHALIRIAKQKNVTQIVIGKSMTSPLVDLVHGGSLVNKIIKQSGGIDVYVVQSDMSSKSPQKKVQVNDTFKSSFLPQYGIAAGVITLIALSCFFTGSVIDYRAIGMILLFTVSTLALFLRRGPVLLGAVLGAILWNYLFIPERFTFSITSLSDFLMLIMYFFVAIVGGSFTARIRRHELTIQQREQDTTFLNNFLQKLIRAEDQSALVRLASEEIKKQFNSLTAIFLSDPTGKVLQKVHSESTLQKINEKEIGVAQWVFLNKKLAGRQTKTLALSELAYFPLLGAQGIVGVAGLLFENNKSLARERETLLLMILQQFALCIERENYRAIAEQLKISSQSENMYKTLLNSVSHQLRTPLVTIKGAATELLNYRTGADPNKRTILAGDIGESADRLDRLVRNILDMSRIESGMLKPRLDWCDIGELIDICIEELHTQIAQHEIVVNITDELPIINADEVLLRQAFLNLIHNALIYTPSQSKILIQAIHTELGIVITIADNGRGIPSQDIPHIFDKFYRSGDRSQSGIGLGLSIARGFIEVNGGTISAENIPGGGAQFTVTLPVKTVDKENG
jgi:two-component system sensor histidine kinase KdpD